MDLLKPSVEISQSYFDALTKGFKDKSRGITTTIYDIPTIKSNFEEFIKSFDDLDASAQIITLPNGNEVERLPSITRWIWNQGFAGSISLRWQKGRSDLPYYCLGHIGYEVVEWKRNQGLATLALKSICELAKRMGMPFVEVVTDTDNIQSQRVTAKNNGVLLETFMKPTHMAQTLSNRYRIDL